MENKTIQLGTRKLQKVSGGHTINIPMVAIKTFGLNRGDVFKMSATIDGTITMKRVMG